MHIFQRCFALLALLMLVAETQSAKILGVFPFPAPSHMIVQKALMLELVKRGHEVTLVTPFLESKPIANLTEIKVMSDMAVLTGGHAPTNLFEMESIGPFQIQIMMWFMCEAMCDNVLKEENIQKLIHATDLHFDLLVVEAFANECFMGFAHKFNIPVIQVCPFGGSTFMGDWVGNPNPYAYVPDEFLEYRDKMSFVERTHSTIIGMLKQIGRELIHIPKQNAMIQKYFNYSDEVLTLSDLDRRISMVLLNTHYSLSYPKPLMPNLVQVGGMHVKPPKKLPQDLQKYLDESPHGVIYFSMGSNLKSSQMPDHKRNAFLQAFSKLKQNVLWKWETDTLPGQPKNVKLGKWLPQSDILAHPNVRLFITHGGLLSTQEAMSRGVPLIGIPIFGDQSLNMGRAVMSGYGIKLDFRNITEESLTWAINEMIGSPKYRENAKRLSSIYTDQPLTPLETAVFWTEYVIRHKGAPHMRSAALDLAWYQYFLLDVIAVLGAALCIALLIPFLIMRAIFRKLCGRKSQAADQVSKRKKKN